MKHFFNPDLRVFNAMTADVDQNIVREFLPLCSGELDKSRFDVVTPSAEKWNSDISWISAATPESFRLFESAFHRLGIPELVRDYLTVEHGVRLYFGSLIIRSRCTQPYFHVDWDRVNNEAFTMITPLAGSASEFGLLYETFDKKVAEYAYKPGEAIVFGDHFRHSTKPGQTGEDVALLCFEFGSDRMDFWDSIFASMGKQSLLFQKPDGSFFRRSE